MASDGFQSSNETMRVQWEGFIDLDSPVGTCVLDVYEVPFPGTRALGQSCTCSEVMPALHLPRLPVPRYLCSRQWP